MGEIITDMPTKELDTALQIKLLNQERDEQFNLRLELKEERDMLADENKKMAEYLLYLNGCNKIPLERDGFGWLFHDKSEDEMLELAYMTERVGEIEYDWYALVKSDTTNKKLLTNFFGELDNGSEHSGGTFLTENWDSAVTVKRRTNATPSEINTLKKLIRL